ncbi:MAG: ammonium transporter [Clostridiales bacterium]|nr:ammonium transporter [Clostridiales bacterium]
MNFRRSLVFTMILLLLVILPGVAMAGEGPTADSNAVAIDTVWTLVAAFLVFFMQAGFAMVEAGFTRAKNAGNIIMKNLMDLSVGSLLFWFIGYGIMFGSDYFGLFGTDGFLVINSGEDLTFWAFLIFQTVFCATAATIVSGAMAERTKFIAYLLYSIGISAIIYPIVGHWIWGGGWLSELGFKDFAGSTVVHSVGGWAGLIGATILGARIGKYGKDGSVNAIPGHSITLGALGVFILWFGWFGFNPGSTVAGTDLSIGLIAVNTNLSAAAGAVTAMITSWIRYGKPDVSLTLNGALAGLVGITAGCAFVDPLGAVVIGLLSGIVLIIAVEIIDKKLKVDDPVGAVAVHGACGALGTVLVGLLDVEQGLLYGGGMSLLLVQLLGVIAVFLWTIGTSYILFKVIDATVGLRVAPQEEESGLDIHEHSLEAYGDFVLKTPSPNVH